MQTMEIKITAPRRVVCPCCGKQLVHSGASAGDKFCTTWKGARASGTAGEAICGYCAEDLDENGMFPEERALAESWVLDSPRTMEMTMSKALKLASEI